MGIAFGRTGTRGPPGRKKKNCMVSHYLIPGVQTARFWLNTTSDDIRCLYDLDGSGRRSVLEEITTDGEPAHRNIITLPLSHYPSLAEIDRFLFHYCELALQPWANILTTRS